MKRTILIVTCILLNACAYIGPDGTQLVIYPPAPVGYGAAIGYGVFGGGIPYNGGWWGMSPYGTGGVYGGGNYPVYSYGSFPY